MLAATVLGVATAIIQWWDAHLKPWLHADPWHGWLIGTGALCILALLALYGLVKEIDLLKREDFPESFAQFLELRFGPTSTRPVEIRRQEAINEFERFEAEILRGNFSHRHEMLAYKDIVLRLLSGAPPLHLQHYSARAEKILDIIRDHDS